MSFADANSFHEFPLVRLPLKSFTPAMKNPWYVELPTCQALNNDTSEMSS